MVFAVWDLSGTLPSANTEGNLYPKLEENQLKDLCFLKLVWINLQLSFELFSEKNTVDLKRKIEESYLTTKYHGQL